MKKIMVLMLALLCIVSLFVGCGNKSSELYNAGIYTAVAEGYAGDVSVEVEFDKTSILSVKVTNHNETIGFGDRAVEALPEEIIEAQTWEVDAISSATVTSNAIKDAVKDCIAQAEKEK